VEELHTSLFSQRQWLSPNTFPFFNYLNPQRNNNKKFDFIRKDAGKTQDCYLLDIYNLLEDGHLCNYFE